MITTNMQQLIEILKTTGIKEMAEEANNRLKEKGFVQTKTYGWEHPDTLKTFGLGIYDTGIPTQLYEESDTKEITSGISFFGK